MSECTVWGMLWSCGNVFKKEGLTSEKLKGKQMVALEWKMHISNGVIGRKSACSYGVQDTDTQKNRKLIRVIRPITWPSGRLRLCCSTMYDRYWSAGKRIWQHILHPSNVFMHNTAGLIYPNTCCTGFGSSSIWYQESYSSQKELEGLSWSTISYSWQFGGIFSLRT